MSEIHELTDLDTSQFENRNNSVKKRGEKPRNPHKDVETKQVETFLEKAKYVANHVKDKNVREAVENVVEKLENGEKVAKHLKLRKYKCRKCGEVFDKRQGYNGHYHGRPHCGDVARWVSDYKNAEEQLKLVMV
jgi:predicted Zn-ribbon and HTH transcriptional regulator